MFGLGFIFFMQNVTVASDKAGGFLFNLYHYVAKNKEYLVGIMTDFISLYSIGKIV